MAVTDSLLVCILIERVSYKSHLTWSEFPRAAMMNCWEVYSGGVGGVNSRPKSTCQYMSLTHSLSLIVNAAFRPPPVTVISAPTTVPRPTFEILNW